MTHGIVVAPVQDAAEAGAYALRLGGNAVDAAIAAAFAEGVVNPLFCGLGGIGEVLIYDAEQKRVFDLDCSVVVPASFDPSLFADKRSERMEVLGSYVIEGGANRSGPLSVMTPGILKGLGVMFEQQFSSGKVPWDQLLLPAQKLAYQGFHLSPYVASVVFPVSLYTLIPSVPCPRPWPSRQRVWGVRCRC